MLLCYEYCKLDPHCIERVRCGPAVRWSGMARTFSCHATLFGSRQRLSCCEWTCHLLSCYECVQLLKPKAQVSSIWGKGCILDDCVGVIWLHMTDLIWLGLGGGRKSWYIIITLLSGMASQDVISGLPRCHLFAGSEVTTVNLTDLWVSSISYGLRSRRSRGVLRVVGKHNYCSAATCGFLTWLFLQLHQPQQWSKEAINLSTGF